MTSRLTYFVSTESQPRARRPIDAVITFLGVMLLAWGWATVDLHPPWEEAMIGFLGTLPSWVTSLLSIGYLGGIVYGIAILVAVLVGGRPRKHAIRDVLLATVVAGAMATVLALLVSGGWPYVLPEIGLEDPAPRFPVLRVVLVTSILASLSPHLSRPLRRFGWVTVGVTAVAAVALGYGDPSDVVGALGIGLIAGGGVLVVFGSPLGYPDPASVGEALRRLGLDLGGPPRIHPEQSWGVRRYLATTAAGAPIVIKAYGRDATDSQVMAKAWRSLIYREGGATVGYSRLQAVEHEALVTLLAGRSGVAVPEVLAVGQAASDIAVLAVAAEGHALATSSPADITDQMMSDVWRQVSRLHEANFAHGSLNTGSTLMTPDGAVLTDFAFGSVVAGEAQRAHDIVELLFSSSLLVGPDRAVATAIDALGRDTVVSVLPYLQLPAIGTATRKAVDKPKLIVRQLQAAAVKATGAELPELVKLLRVSRKSLLTGALMLLAAYALIPLFTQVDYSSAWAVVQDASWPLMILALIVGQSYFLPQATATSFAVARPLPFWPLVVLQVAAKFIGLAVPSAAGRVAMNAAFLRKFGVSTTTAVAQGAIDGFSGFLVQVAILLIALIASDFEIDTSSLEVSWGVVLLIVALLVFSLVLIVLRVRRIRNAVLPAIREGWGALMTVLHQPSRALGLLGSNLVYWLTLGATLWLILTAIGVEMSFGVALVVAVATDLLGGFVPIPGGVGVSEAVMTGFLAALGVDQSAAFAAAVSYRAITFYLAASEGFFALRWLERNEYV